MATLPPGVSSADFSTALGQFAEAVGPDWVFSSDEDVALYRDAYSPFWGEEQELVASAAVSPTRVEEVQEVVRIANQYQIPLYPISTGSTRSTHRFDSGIYKNDCKKRSLNHAFFPENRNQ